MVVKDSIPTQNRLLTRPLTQEEISNIVQLGKEGKTVLEIIKKTGHCRDTVNRWLRRNGVEAKARKPRPYTDDEIEFINQHYKIDMTAREIAEVLDRSIFAVKFRSRRSSPGQRLVNDKKVRELHAQNLTINEIAEILDFSRLAIQKSLQRMNLRPNVKDAPNLKGQRGEFLAEKFFERNNLEILERGTKRSPFDFIVKRESKTFSVNVKNHSTDLRVNHRNLKNLAKFGVPVILWKYGNEWTWLEVKQW